MQLKTNLNRLLIKHFNYQQTMRDINDDDFNGMDGHGRGSSGPLFNKFLSLTPGKGFELLKKEWHKKYPPTRTANSVMKKYKIVKVFY